jgi:hypothetical protein
MIAFLRGDKSSKQNFKAMGKVLLYVEGILSREITL